MNYGYPFDISWTKQEIVDVIQFFTLIEKAYEEKVNRNKLLLSYNRLKEIVPSKSEEKKLFSQFQKESGYSCYPVIKKAKENNISTVSMR